MNKFKVTFALLAVLVILAAPAYAAAGLALSSDTQSHPMQSVFRCAEKLSEMPHAERQT